MEKLQNIFRIVFEDDTIILRPEMTAEDIDMWDSLTHMTLIAEIEDAFGFRFSFDVVHSFQNVGDMAKAIKELSIEN